MKNESYNLVPAANELVIAIVQPAGTDLNNIRARLNEGFKKVQSQVELVDLTSFIEILNFNSQSLLKVKRQRAFFQKSDRKKSENYRSLSDKMHVGSLLREHVSAEIFAIFGMSEIHARRKRQTKALRKKGESPREHKTIYILDSLKHPSEVELLRKAYGSSFLLLAVSADKDVREANWRTLRGMKTEEVSELISRDENEGLKNGQKMSAVFEQADYFFESTCSQDEIDRFVELTFNNTKLSPGREEYYMHLASSAAAKSSDLSRQVGAVLISPTGEILSLGFNEVPKFGGGQYSYGEEPDWRDVRVGHDPNEKRREQISKGLKTDKVAMELVKNLTEFHRTVHAEMEALMSCARKGISTAGSILFTTTYPCHNCAKHIVNAGVSKVVYLEGYPKSQAFELHNDSIGHSMMTKNKVSFLRYKGVGPRRYFDFFSLKLTAGKSIDRKGVGVGKDWEASIFDSQNAVPKFSLMILTADGSEKIAAAFINRLNLIDLGKARRVLSVKANAA